MLLIIIIINIAAALTDIKHYDYYFSSNHLIEPLVFGVSLSLNNIHLMTDYNIAAALTNMKHYYYYFSSNQFTQSLVFGVPGATDQHLSYTIAT